MAKSVVGLEVNVSGNAESSVKSLKTQLREAQQDVQKLSEKFGATSDAAISAARRAAELKDAIGDAKALTDAFNPDRKFQAFSGAIQSVVGGFSALQGAQALFGGQSEQLEKTLVKVQAAMALSQGINSILEAKDAFKVLGIVAMDALKGIRAAIGSTGIGLLAIAIGAIVMAMKDWYDSTQKQVSAEELLKQKEEALRDEIKKTNDEIENRNKINNYLSQVEILNAKARGASVQELRKIEDKFYYEQAYNRQVAKDDAIKAFEEAEKNYTKDSQIYKDALDQKNKKLEEWYEGNRQRELELGRRRVEDYNADVAKNKQRVDEIIAENKRIADANAAQNDLQKKLQDEITLSLIANERDRAATKLEMDLENAKRDVERTAANENEKNESILLLERQFMINLRAMQDKWAEEDIAKIQENATKQANENNKKRQKQTEDRQKDLEEQRQYNEAVLQAERELQDEKFNIVLGGLSALQTLAQGNEKLANILFAIEKAATIARIVVNTQQEIAGYYANPTWKFMPDGGIALASAASAKAKIRAGISIASILATTIAKFKNGGAGGSVPTPTNQIGMNAPLVPQAQMTTLNQGQINQLASATTRAFVLESDVSGNQERIRRINRAARIN